MEAAKADIVDITAATGGKERNDSGRGNKEAGMHCEVIDVIIGRLRRPYH